MIKSLAVLPVLSFFVAITVSAQQKNDLWLQKLFLSKASPLLLHVLNHPDSFQYQIIYTQINRDKKNDPTFTNYFLNVDRNRYFNPASTVKLPTVLAALEKLNSMQIKGVDKSTIMLTDSSYSGQSAVTVDTSSMNGFPSISQYAKRIFLISDNEAYNRLYEFTGQQTLNETLRRKGYTDVRITRRFVPMTEEENRHTNSIRFIKNGKVIYQQPAAYSNITFDFSKKILVGKGHWDKDDKLVDSPMDFTTHNNLPLEDLQQILQSVIFPFSVRKKQRFLLTKDDYSFLYKYMSALPSESRYPTYDTTEYFDSYAKFFYKDGKQKIPGYIRIFNKPGWSYGFLTDAAYVADFKNGVEFMLSAVIYVNRDGVLNDNKYEYAEIGYPFFAEIYKIIYQFELGRKKQYMPNLNRLKFHTEENIDSATSVN
ncbi:MAG: class A beta-lactamase-related serine hydrolase [Bacteroidota bacterium]|nr:class A beta-lactamase-related serine hydrolase [Bacteroidota bacterium]